MNLSNVFNLNFLRSNVKRYVISFIWTLTSKGIWLLDSIRAQTIVSFKLFKCFTHRTEY